MTRASLMSALLERHRAFAPAQTPPEHSSALDLDQLPDPALTFSGFRAHGILPGTGAIKCPGPDHAEIKPMHTAEAARGRGTGRAMLTHLLEAARTQGLRRVSLQTGTTAASAPARALYRRAGFISRGPFATHQPSEDNLFMTLELDAVPPGRRASRARTRSAPVIMGAADQTSGTRQTASQEPRIHPRRRAAAPFCVKEHDRSPKVKLSLGNQAADYARRSSRSRRHLHRLQNTHICATSRDEPRSHRTMSERSRRG